MAQETDMKRTSLRIGISILTFQGILFAQSKVGTTAASFLGIHAGPRAVAMGGAFSAMGDDASSLYYNPGGFSRLPRSQVLVSTTRWVLGTRFHWIGIGLKLDAADAIGISFVQLDYGEEEVTTVLVPEGTGEKWGAGDFAVGLSYGRNLTDRFSIGGTAKYIQQTVWHETASAFAFDVGLLFQTPFRGMRLGMSICNFGADMRFDGRDLIERIDLDPEAIGNNGAITAKLKTDAWPLPLFFRVGLAGEPVKTRQVRVSVAVDAMRPSDNTETLLVGAEAALLERAFLRAGYQSLFRKDRDSGLTLGAGLRVPIHAGVSCNVDYALAYFNRLPDVQTASIALNF
jgi:hypothetical protein